MGSNPGSVRRQSFPALSPNFAPYLSNIPRKPILGPAANNSKSLKRKSNAVRFYYKTNLIQMTPLPWVRTYTPELDDYFTELIIRQLSRFGTDSKASYEFDFRKIFKDNLVYYILNPIIW